MTVRRPLTILHVASHDGVYRGGAVQLCRMAVGQRARGDRVSVVANIRRSRSEEEQRAHRESWNPHLGSAVVVHELDFKKDEALRRLWWLMRFSKIVHAHRDEALLAVKKAAKGIFSPAIVAQRGTISCPEEKVIKAFRSEKIRAIIAVAKAVKNELIRAAGKKITDKVHVVYGSVDLQKFAPREPDRALRKELGLPDGAPIIGSLSAWRKAKRLDILLAAAAPILKARPEVRLLLVGRAVEENLRPAAEELGVAGQCIFAGHQADVARWLSIMSFSVVAADSREGLSGVLRESLAMGIPVISTDCAGNNEIVQDGKTGLLAPPGDAGALEHSIRKAVGDIAAMKSMAQRGRDWVRENCSVERQVLQLDAIYRGVLK